MTVWRGRACCGLLVCALIAAASTASAQSAGTAAPRVGWSSTGMRGLERIHLPVAPAPEVAVAANAGYAFTESQGSQRGAHHRALGTIGLGASLQEWIGVGLRFDGRHDVHPDDGMGGDESTVGDPRLLVRAGGAASDRVLLGGEAVLWVPGEDAPSLAFAATTLDLRATAALLAPQSPWTVAASLGYRLDNSAKAAPDLATLRPGDRLALDLSSFDAALIGVGVAHRSGALELFGEASWDVLVGSGAPSATRSPMRLGLGARVRLAQALQLALAANLSPSGRPEPSATELVPIEPRFGLSAGLRYAFGASLPLTHERSAAEPEAPPPVRAAAPTEAPASGALAGRLLDAGGTPVEGARVTLRAAGTEQTTETDAQGGYAFADVPYGPVELSAERDGYAGAQWSAEHAPDGGGSIGDQVLPRTAVGQLRGLALSFKGKPVAAQVRVQPLDQDGATAQELRAGTDGRFQLDLPPGRYEVAVTAEGFAAQTRTVSIEADGVVILNLDLRAER